MSKDAYHGPLEQVSPCCWRIPKSYKPGMRVDGLIFADDQLIEQIRQRPGARAGRQRRVPAGHPARQPGHARHPLGLRLLHRRRLRDRSGRRRRDFAGRRRLRHQLRRAAGAHQPLRTRTSSRSSTALIEQLCSQTSRPASAAAASTASTRKELRRLMAEGVALTCKTQGLATDGDLEHTEAGGRLDGAEPGQRQRAGPGARRRPVRHARLGQPLPGSAGRRRDLRRSRPPRPWGWKRTWSA